MDFDRELASLEKRLTAQDPELALKLGTFETDAGRTVEADAAGAVETEGPAPSRPRRGRLLALVMAVVCLVIAVASALAVGSATGPSAPTGTVERQHAGSGG